MYRLIRHCLATGGLMYRIGAFSALGGFLFGYDLGLIGGALLNIQNEWGITTLQAEIIVGAAKFGAVFGSILGGGLMLQYGRRWATAIDSAFFILGPLIMMAAFNVTCLVIGRFIIGIGIGVSAVVTPAYLGEMSPAEQRGKIVALYEVMLCAGMFASLLADWAFNPYWRLMVGAPVLPAVLQSFAVCVLPESPRWLLLVGDYDGALAVIHKITSQKMISNPEAVMAEAEDELLHLWSSIEKAKYAQAAARDKILNRRRLAISELGNSSSTAAFVPDQSACGEIEEGGGQEGESTPEEEYRGAVSNGGCCDFAAIEMVEMTEDRAAGPGLEHADSGTGLTDGPENIRDRLPLSEAGRQRGSLLSRCFCCCRGCGNRGSSRVQGGLQASLAGTIWTMITDIYVVATGEEAHAFALCCWLSFFNQATASTAIINYAPTVLKELGGSDGQGAADESAILSSSPVAAAKLIGVLIGMVTLDRLGRRPLLISSSVGSGLAMVMLTIGVRAQSRGLSVAAMSLFILSFSWGWASGFWVLVSELFSMAVKSPAASAVTAGLFTAGFLTNLVFLSIYKWLGEWAFLVFGFVAFLSGAYVFVAVPETKGKTLLQIQEMLSSYSAGSRGEKAADDSTKHLNIGVPDSSGSTNNTKTAYYRPYSTHRSGLTWQRFLGLQ